MTSPLPPVQTAATRLSGPRARPAGACVIVDAMEDTWFSRDLPVLTYLVERLDRFDVHRVDLPEIEQATGLSSDDVARALKALDGEFIEGLKQEEFSYPLFITGITGAARRAVGAWSTPDSLVDRIVSGLDAAADQEPDPSRKSKLREFAEALGGSMREVVVEVVGATIARGIGIGM